MNATAPMLGNMARKKMESRIAEKLVALRRARGLTQNDVARTIGRHQSRLAKWELGEGVPQPGDLLRLSEMFDVPVAYLCDDSVDDPAEVSKGPELTQDEVLILGIVRKIGPDRALDRLMGMPTPAPGEATPPVSIIQRPVKPK
jgi:transcriptional regulator with XRE-family HTH domain